MIIYLLILIIFLIKLFLFLIFILDILILGHNLPTSKKALKEIQKIINKYGSSASNFYDLGCGYGRVVLNIKKKFKKLEVFGIDKNFIRIFFSKLKALILNRKIKFINENIFNINLSKADIIYTYLWYDIMPPLEEKLKKELKPGTIVITNTSNFKNIKPIEIISTHLNRPKSSDFEKLFVYKF